MYLLSSPICIGVKEVVSHNRMIEDQDKTPIFKTSDFIAKLFQIITLENPPLISWRRGSVNIHNPVQVATELLPKYYRHSRFSSFIRNLNKYGFKKAKGTGKLAPCTFSHPQLSERDDPTALLDIRLNKGSERQTPNGMCGSYLTLHQLQSQFSEWGKCRKLEELDTSSKSSSLVAVNELKRRRLEGPETSSTLSSHVTINESTPAVTEDVKSTMGVSHNDELRRGLTIPSVPVLDPLVPEERRAVHMPPPDSMPPPLVSMHHSESKPLPQIVNQHRSVLAQPPLYSVLAQPRTTQVQQQRPPPPLSSNMVNFKDNATTSNMTTTGSLPAQTRGISGSRTASASVPEFDSTLKRLRLRLGLDRDDSMGYDNHHPAPQRPLLREYHFRHPCTTKNKHSITNGIWTDPNVEQSPGRKAYAAKLDKFLTDWLNSPTCKQWQQLAQSAQHHQLSQSSPARDVSERVCAPSPQQSAASTHQHVNVHQEQHPPSSLDHPPLPSEPRLSQQQPPPQHHPFEVEPHLSPQQLLREALGEYMPLIEQSPGTPLLEDDMIFQEICSILACPNIPRVPSQ